MRAFLLGFALVYAIGVGIVLATDQAVRVNNPWALSFVLSGLVVPSACGWAGVELAGLVLRRRLLEPGRTHWFWRGFRGVIGGLIGMCGAVILAAAEKPDWPDYVRTGATALLAAVIVASIGRNRKLWACRKCGYDLRGLTTAARGLCPECGTEGVAGENNTGGRAARVV